jgi:ABC-type bacteriocin/lantibiotic exporter with double-glycine peptidase domain
LPKVRIRLVEQKEDNDCAVACAMMLMGWMKDNYPDTPDFDYDEMSKILGWNKSGAAFCNITRLNKNKKFQPSRYRPQFYCSPATTIDHLWSEIDANRPVIAYLQVTYMDSLMRHSVVVYGYSRDKTKMYLLDPLEKAPVERPTAKFYTEWNDIHKFQIHVKIHEVSDLTRYIADGDT